jgi:hypothetical protein
MRRIRRWWALGLAVVSGGAVSLAVVAVTSSPASASGTDPGCTATAPPNTTCTFTPSGTAVSYTVGRLHGRSEVQIIEDDPTCTAVTNNILTFTKSNAAHGTSGTFTLNTAGDCVRLNAYRHATVTASG